MTVYTSGVRRRLSDQTPASTSATISSAGTARRATSGQSRHCAMTLRRATLASLGGSLAENSLRTEDEDRDQDREDDRLGPLRAGAVPGKPLVEVLDQTDQECAQYRSGKIA